jgi:hypothetical protein
MRRILIDAARAHAAEKRGGPLKSVVVPADWGEIVAPGSERTEELLALDEALNRLVAMDGRRGKIVELRVFGGLSVEETSEVLGVSAVTVMRDWRVAKAWLVRELHIRLASACEQPLGSVARSRFRRVVFRSAFRVTHYCTNTPVFTAPNARVAVCQKAICRRPVSWTLQMRPLNAPFLLSVPRICFWYALRFGAGLRRILHLGGRVPDSRRTGVRERKVTAM